MGSPQAEVILPVYFHVALWKSVSSFFTFIKPCIYLNILQYIISLPKTHNSGILSTEILY